MHISTPRKIATEEKVVVIVQAFDCLWRLVKKKDSKKRSKDEKKLRVHAYVDVIIDAKKNTKEMRIFKHCTFINSSPLMSLA